MILLNRLFYYGLIVPLSLLPFPVLYALSDFLYVILYYVVGYRKNVVMENLRKSFPDKSEQEITVIAKKFFRNFCDLLLESLKLFTISETEALKRMVYKNPEIFEKYYREGRSVILTLGHYNNWEFAAVTMAAIMKHKPSAIYKPLTNRYFDQKMRESRTKYGMGVIHNKHVMREFEAKKNNLTVPIFVIDQAPSTQVRPHWMKFLNQETAILTGTERYAKKYNYPIVFMTIDKPRRGFYEVEFFHVTDTPTDTKPGEITEQVTKILEKDIINKPEFWLWSHRRWKYKKENYPREVGLK